MEELTAAAVSLVKLLSPAKAASVASLLVGKSASDARVPAGLLSTTASTQALQRLVDTWRRHPLPGDLVAGIIRGAAAARADLHAESSIELVWTGPTTPFVPTRRTDQVLLDLIRSSVAELFIVSFVAYDVPAVTEALRAARSRNVRTRMLLESSTDSGGTLSVDSIAAIRKAVPGIELYAWQRRTGIHSNGKVHAKAGVADRRVAFITSANLTGHALEKNMELGMLLTGGPIPPLLADHLDSLIEVGDIEQVRSDMR